MSTTTNEHKKMKALCMHGFRTNSAIMEYQTTKLRGALPDVEFTYLDGPIAATGPAEPAVEDFWKGDKFYQWWDAMETDKPSTASRLEYKQASTSLEHITDYISREGPFDILVGFSHGANFITMLTAHYEHLADGDMSKVPYKAVLLFCGGANGPEQATFDPVRDGMQQHPLRTPSVHVIGEKDSIAAASHALVQSYESDSSRTVIVHTGGHDFPQPVNKACARIQKKMGGPPLVNYYAQITKSVYGAVASTPEFRARTQADSATQAGFSVEDLLASGAGYVQAKQHLQTTVMRHITCEEKKLLTKQIWHFARVSTTVREKVQQPVQIRSHPHRSSCIIIGAANLRPSASAAA